jgi:hypothetical protein
MTRVKNSGLNDAAVSLAGCTVLRACLLQSRINLCDDGTWDASQFEFQDADGIAYQRMVGAKEPEAEKGG